jgi:hypothetical protein
VAIVATEKVTAKLNYEHNKKNTAPTDYINNQNTGNYHNWKFGLSTMDKNGWGVIATYNLLKMLGDTKNLADIAYEIESKSGTLVLGFFGTDPTHFGEYFKGKNKKTTAYASLDALEKAAKNMSESQRLILTKWNESSVLKGAHVVAVKKSGNYYTVYNPNGYGKSDDFNTLKAYIKEGSLIIGYVVGKNET